LGSRIRSAKPLNNRSEEWEEAEEDVGSAMEKEKVHGGLKRAGARRVHGKLRRKNDRPPRESVSLQAWLRFIEQRIG